MQLEDHLDDLCVRFIINIPAEEFESVERICFQIEEAQWFYEDWIRENNPQLPSLSLKPFFTRIIQRCPGLEHWSPEKAGEAFDQFIAYKQRVPVRGVIMLNKDMDEVLLVKGYKKSGTWSFPRGKINEGEDDLDCAVREAFEETGFDLRKAGFVEHRNKIRHVEVTMKGQNIKLFVFPGVSKDTQFAPQTRKEISKIQWYKLSDLPFLRKTKAQHEGTGQHLITNPNKFYMVGPFIAPLRKIISQERKRVNRSARSNSQLAAPPLLAEDLPTEDEMQAYQPHLQHMTGPLSPPVPSSLPEVTTAPMHDPLANLRHQLNIPSIEQPSHAPQVDTQKSNALLALLRQPSLPAQPEPRHLDQSAFMPPPRIQEQRPRTFSQHPSDFHLPAQHWEPTPPTQATAPPASALPQLSQHTKSLLDAFSQPNTAAVSRQEPTRQLTANKANLLAAFGAKSPSLPSAAPSVSSTNADTLLQLLSHAPSSQTAKSPVSAEATTVSSSTLPQKPTDARTLLQAFTSKSPAPLTSSTSAYPQSSSVVQNAQQLPATPEINTNHLSVEKAIPVELSASPAQAHATPTAKTKQDLLSALGKKPKQQSASPQTMRGGSTSARLNGPLNQPEFDAISKSIVVDDESKRGPIVGERRLYDHKQDEFRQGPAAKPQGKQRDNSKPPRSPRTARSRNTASPRANTTPKEPQKPFQPQILKRPQAGDTEAQGLETRKSSIESTSVKSGQPGIIDISQILTQTSTNKPAASPIPLRAVSEIPRSAPAPKPVAVVDPHKVELLSLLRRPPSRALSVDPEATPEGPLAPTTSPLMNLPPSRQSRSSSHEHAFPGHISPLAASQIVSPVHEGETEPLSTRSRVSSLASTGNGVMGGNVGSHAQAEKRQTTASDKAFLLNYLKGFAANT